VSLRNDIALLKLEVEDSPITLSSTVHPACLPTNEQILEVDEGTICIVTGWGGLGKSINPANQFVLGL